MPEKSEVVREAMSQMPNSEGLANLSELGKQLALELAIQEELGKSLAESVAKTTRLQDVTLPELMNTLGLSELKLKTGEIISLQTVYGCSVPDDRKSVAWQWLRDNGYGSLIKVTLAMAFGMGEEALADKARVALNKKGIAYKDKEDVHASTLKSFVKERYEKGDKFPEAIFGAFTKTIARLKTK